MAGLVMLLIWAGWGAWRSFENHKSLDHNRIAIIKQDQKVIEEINLDAVTEPREIILPGKYHEIVEVEPGRIRFKQADCPDKICVKTGWLENPGDTAVCLPNRAVIAIAE
jgi:hypothetical protein